MVDKVPHTSVVRFPCKNDLLLVLVVLYFSVNNELRALHLMVTANEIVIHILLSLETQL